MTSMLNFVEAPEMTPKKFYDIYIAGDRLNYSPHFPNSKKESNVIIEKLYLQLPVDSIILLANYDEDYKYTVIAGNELCKTLDDYYSHKLNLKNILIPESQLWFRTEEGLFKSPIIQRKINLSKNFKVLFLDCDMSSEEYESYINNLYEP